MTEGIKIDRRGRCLGKIFLKKAAAGQDLADQTLSGGHIAVRLNIPPADDMPTVFPDQTLNPHKKRRVMDAHIVIQQGLVMIKDQPVIFLTEIRRHPKGGQSRCQTLILLP